VTDSHGIDNASIDQYYAEKSKGLKEGEDELGDVIYCNTDNLDWTDKYKPRKPRFFNRVKTGYEWNKYN